MLIAIDFDDTLTADPGMWREFIMQAQSRGHGVIGITARRDTEENRALIAEWLAENCISALGFRFTGLSSKLDWAAKQGIKVDIWIDDDPRKLVNGH